MSFIRQTIQKVGHAKTYGQVHLATEKQILIKFQNLSETKYDKIIYEHI